MSELAAGFDGVLDIDELRGCGLTQQSVDRRARAGRIHRIHEGVYAIGHPGISLRGRFIAAVKACRPHAALSHRAEAARAEIREWTERDIEVTVPAGVMHVHPGIQVHRSSLLTRGDLLLRDGMLVTNAAWTIVALAAVLPTHELREAVRTALGARLVSVPTILELLSRLGPVRGSGKLRQVLASGVARTRSELEDVVLALILSGGFAMPEVNEPLVLEGRKVIPDFRWPEQRLIVEADGARWHDDPISHANDRERQALLQRHGETVVRVRWDQAILRSGQVHAKLVSAGAPYAYPPCRK